MFLPQVRQVGQPNMEMFPFGSWTLSRYSSCEDVLLKIFMLWISTVGLNSLRRKKMILFVHKKNPAELFFLHVSLKGSVQ